MTGWRLGFGIMPKEPAARVDLLLTHPSAPPRISRSCRAGSHHGPQDMVDVMVSNTSAAAMPSWTVECPPRIGRQVPQGAFYVFPNITGTGMGSTELANLILEKAGVALLPEIPLVVTAKAIWLSYANSIENIQKGWSG
jgi:aspartate/methionine/tyrosine aminotransferase